MPDKKLTAHKEKQAANDKHHPAASDLVPDQASADKSQSDKIEDERDGKKQIARKRARRRRRRIKTQKRLQVWTPLIISALVLFVTSVYTFFSFQQWQTMEKSLQITQKAYIRINDIQADFKAGKIRVVFENIGHVPAKSVQVRIDIERNAKGHPLNELPIEWNTYGFITPFTEIAPGGIRTVADVPLENFTQEDADLIRAGKQTLSVACWLSYDDGFHGWIKDALFDFTYIPPPNEGWANMIPTQHEDIRKRHESEGTDAGGSKASPN